MISGKVWGVTASECLSFDEVSRVVREARRKAPRSVNTRQNLALFRLATCCGLRVSEAIGLRLNDLHLAGDRPYIQVRRAIAKGKKARRVPLYWDNGTLLDLISWVEERKRQGAKATDPLLCGQSKNNKGNPLDRFNARKRYIAMCSITGRRDITIHTGRHTFVSLALAKGVPLAEVKEAAGHSSIATTDIYTHVAEQINATNQYEVFGGC